MSKREESRRELESWQEAGKTLIEQVEQRKTDAFWAIFDSPESDGISFIWEGEDSDPWTEKSIRRAFELSGRADLLGFGDGFTDYVLGSYYITDILEGDTRSLSNKYEGKEARLIPGNNYFLCKI